MLVSLYISRDINKIEIFLVEREGRMGDVTYDVGIYEGVFEIGVSGEELLLEERCVCNVAV